jgi:hypothetical protein
MTALFDGGNATEHAEAAADAVRAINHITSWPAALGDPAEAYTVLGHLAAVAAMLPQAFVQISRQVTAWHDAGLIGIDPGTRYHDSPTKPSPTSTPPSPSPPTPQVPSTARSRTPPTSWPTPTTSTRTATPTSSAGWVPDARRRRPDRADPIAGAAPAAPLG